MLTTTQVFATSTPHTHIHTSTPAQTHTQTTWWQFVVGICHQTSSKLSCYWKTSGESKKSLILLWLTYNIRWHWLPVCVCVWVCCMYFACVGELSISTFQWIPLSHCALIKLFLCCASNLSASCKHFVNLQRLYMYIFCICIHLSNQLTRLCMLARFWWIMSRHEWWILLKKNERLKQQIEKWVSHKLKYLLYNKCFKYIYTLSGVDLQLFNKILYLIFL